MAERSLVERKLEVSKELIQGLKAISAPLLAAYWELASERDRWSFYLVPKSIPDERKLVDAVSRIMITAPYRSVFFVVRRVCRRTSNRTSACDRRVSAQRRGLGQAI